MTTDTKTTARAEIYDAAINNHWKVVDVIENWSHTTYRRGYGSGTTHNVVRFIIEPDFSAGGEWGAEKRVIALFSETDAFFAAYYQYISNPLPDSYQLHTLARNRLTKAKTLALLRNENGPARKLRQDECKAAVQRSNEARLRAHDDAVEAAYGPALEEAMAAWEKVVDAVAHELPYGQLPMGVEDVRGLARAITAAVIGDLDESPGPVAVYLAAHHAAKRIGEGWLPGQTSLTGTYVNGRRVSE